MMIKFIMFLMIAIGLLSIYSKLLSESADPSRRNKKPLNKMKPTMFHVRDLIIKGKKEEAVQLYSQIFSVDRQQAQEAVDQLERSIQEKNFEV